MSHKAALPKTCIALGVPSVEKLLTLARQEAEAGETFLEFRVDYLSDPMKGVAAIATFLSEHPQCTILATCRRHQNHGHYNGSIEEQVKILDAAITSGARAIDLEIESAENIQSRLEPLRGRAWLVLSYHNFGGTPSLEAVLRRMQKIPADAYKLVSTARKPSDNYRVLSLAKTNPRAPLVLLAMSETGFPTRVLSTALGGLYTYAAPTSAEGTAAGQVSAKQLRNVYRIEKFTKNAKIYGVIADPVRHSISPAVHNRAFQSKRLDCIYLPFLVHPPQLKDFFLFAEKMPISGFSVTIPHKQKILRYLDTVDPLARRIGAVNTVFRKAGKWRGLNTDVQGVLGPLSKRVKLAKSSVLVIGNGGAARGAAFALADAGAKVSLVGRNADRVRALAKACNAEPLLKDQVDSHYFDAVIHATPLGMFPHTDECFFHDKIPGDLVFDMVYNPLETQLLKRAAEQKKEIVTGLQMFLEQAALQFETWTGESAPRAAMDRAASEALGHGAMAAAERP
ncbi:MAG: shikimate dehydrogenase [Bryobacterales bacterium]|nr:shikimate dehydrogenase [Bryobacterales bacterium]